MKHLLLISVVIVTLLSCKKEHVFNVPNNSYAREAWKYLKDSLRTSDLNAIDFSELSIIDNSDGHFLRITTRSEENSTGFIVLQTDPAGKPFRGKIVSLQRTPTGLTSFEFNGSITIASLNRSSELRSEIIGGYIVGYHTRSMVLSSNSSNDVHPDPAQHLPEVVVVGYKNSNYGTPYLIEMLRYSTLFSPNYNQTYGSYDPMNPSAYYLQYGGGYNYPSNSSGGNSTTNNGSDNTSSLMIEYDHIADRPTVNINKIFKCFEYIPSAGASYTLKLCTDLPVNKNPFASMDNSSKANAGHTFISLTKSNGNESVTQSFGFYPSSMPSIFDPFAEIRGGIKDNGATEINASIEVKISEAQFNVVKTNAITGAVQPYSLSNYNCANYAINIFNSVSRLKIDTDPLSIPVGTADPYNPTSLRTIQIPKSPQMLFITLQELKYSGEIPPESVVIDRSHNHFAPISKGECN